MMKTGVSPHFHARSARSTIERSMWNVNIALLPALAASVYFFGIRSLILVAVSIITALLSEAGIQRWDCLQII